MSTQNTLPLSQIRTDGGTQTRAALNPETVRDYAEAYNRGEQLPPVIVFYDGADYWLADGFHRVTAIIDGDQDNSWNEIEADVRQGTRRDAILFSVAANATHGLPRSKEDKTRAVEKLLLDDEWVTWSNREIARRTKTHHVLVGDVRRRLEETGEIEPVTTRTVIRDGQEVELDTRAISAANVDRAESDEEHLIDEIDPVTAEVTPRQVQADPQVASPREALHSSATVEWYTPPEWIAAVREVLGTIDLDPASCEAANKIVGAEIYFDQDHDGLSEDWVGSVFLNPPYGKTGNQSNQAIWSRYLLDQFNQGYVNESILLVNANTGDQWWHDLVNAAPVGSLVAYARRIKFIDADGKQQDQPTHGSAFIYFGPDPDRFRQVFGALDGVIVQPFAVEQPTDDPVRVWIREQLAGGKQDYDTLLHQARADNLAVGLVAHLLKVLRDEGEVKIVGKSYALTSAAQSEMLDDSDQPADNPDWRAIIHTVIEDRLSPTLGHIYIVFQRMDIEVTRDQVRAWVEQLVEEGELERIGGQQTGKPIRYRKHHRSVIDVMREHPDQCYNVAALMRETKLHQEAVEHQLFRGKHIGFLTQINGWWVIATDEGAAGQALANDPAGMDDATGDSVEGHAASHGDPDPDATRETEHHAPLTADESAIIADLHGLTEAYVKAWWDGTEAEQTPAHLTLIQRGLIQPVTKWSSGSEWRVGYVLTDNAGQIPADSRANHSYFKEIARLKRNGGSAVGGVNQRLGDIQDHLSGIDAQEFAQFVIQNPRSASLAPVIQASLDLLPQIEAELMRLLAIAKQGNRHNADLNDEVAQRMTDAATAAQESLSPAVQELYEAAKHGEH